jgi:hypothetical protein
MLSPGANKKILVLALVGSVVSFANNFNPSAKVVIILYNQLR